MNMNETDPEDVDNRDSELGTLLAHAIASAQPGLTERIETDLDAYLELVAITADAGHEVAGLLRSSVASARTAGLSWDRIGRALNMSRQAAQQRFGAGPVPAGPQPGDTKVLTPLTAFDEMEELDRVGRHGWHSIGFGTLFHTVQKSGEQWEHLRVYAIGRSRHSLELDGWQRIGSMWFPWAYYARSTGRPALPEE